MREIENSSIHVGTSIIDPHPYMFPVRQIHDPNHTAEWEGPVGRRQRIHIENFSVGRYLAVELFSIPGCNPPVLNPDIQSAFPFGNPRTGSQQQAQDDR